MISVELIKAILGEPAHIGTLPESFAQFSIDSRTILPDELFFALAGEERDGHQFLSQVAEKALAAIVTKVDPALPLTQWQVADTTIAMGELAKALRQLYRHIPLVGITGSCGKTTTTSLLAHICQSVKPTLASQKSFNNKWGVPITLSRLTACDELIIQEIGMNHRKEIEYITKVAQPNIALITNIAPVHLEGLGSLDAIAEEKSDIFIGLAMDGTAVINADDPYKIFITEKLLPTQKVIYFSMHDISADVFVLDEPIYTHTHSYFKMELLGEIKRVELPLLGEHNVANALAATACALALGIAVDDIVDALHTAEPPAHRLVRHQSEKGYTVLDDSYNANPLAMKMAFQTLAREEGRLVAVLGDMAECGTYAEQVHRQLAHDLKENGIQTVFSTGRWMYYLDQEAKQLGLKSYYAEQKSELIHLLKAGLHAEDTVLVKGSNSTGMQAVVEAIY